MNLKLIYKTRNRRAILFFCLFYVSFGGFITINQENLIYQPSNQDIKSCAKQRDGQLKEVNGTKLYVKEHPERMVVLYHGNAGSVCDRFYYLDLITNAGWGYVLVQYSGYGDDDVNPTHAGIQNDVKNVIAYLDIVQPKETFLIGESVGTGVASRHSFLRSPDALLLITPFDTLTNLARHHYWFYPIKFMINDTYDNLSALNKYQGSVTVIHGTKDKIIPIQLAKNLYDSIMIPNKTFVIIDDVDHNNLWLYPKTSVAIEEFLKQNI